MLNSSLPLPPFDFWPLNRRPRRPHILEDVSFAHDARKSELLRLLVSVHPSVLASSLPGAAPFGRSYFPPYLLFPDPDPDFDPCRASTFASADSVKRVPGEAWISPVLRLAATQQPCERYSVLHCLTPSLLSLPLPPSLASLRPLKRPILLAPLTPFAASASASLRLFFRSPLQSPLPASGVSTPLLR